MALIRPFRALRPRTDLAGKVAALPYDVYSSDEARVKVEGDSYSFLRIDRPETQFDEGCDMYAPCIYQKADEMLKQMEADGVFVQDERACYYIYELVMNGRAQTGLVACSSVDDYINGVVKKHENTRKDKEEDRVRHVDVCSAQTGPIFLAYRAQDEVREILEAGKEKAPVCEFTADDGVVHRVWVIEEEAHIRKLTEAFGKMGHTYIADGHHRAASAVRVSLKRREAHPGYTGEEEYNYFLSVLFADEELMIMDYNRVLKDLNGYAEEEVLNRLKDSCTVEDMGKEAYRPKGKGEFGLYLDKTWYRLQVKAEHCLEDPVGSLDVAFLQREILEPVFGIMDPKTDSRIDFVGGIRGLQELERRCETDCACAFAMYPTSIGELFDVADADLLMPPKSTWFEPKLRSGLFVHKIER
ncbi:MAG TPA: DUF1015 domain-containing protein [Candidatus Pelethocola excrementipullorum]|nr:DUF1015 domain-containing protein [Candidatus Pelethocola excrementipullorum]